MSEHQCLDYIAFDGISILNPILSSANGERTLMDISSEKKDQKLK
jgi:hypothetical protein